MSREMLVGFSEVDEERTIEAFEECCECEWYEELNLLEGYDPYPAQESFPVITIEV